MYTKKHKLLITINLLFILSTCTQKSQNKFNRSLQN
jgi:hypothetical protein